MRRPIPIIALAAALPVLAAAAAYSPSGSPPGDPLRGLDGVRPGAVEPPVTSLMPGDRAPDFGYESDDGTPLRLRDLLAHGHVLLVFEATQQQLAAIEGERAALQKRGVLAVAVLERSPRTVRALAQKLDLHFTLVPDPRSVIGAQFNVLGSSTRRSQPAWFVLDRKGKVRALDRRKIPSSGFTALAAAALGLPAPDATMPSGAR